MDEIIKNLPRPLNIDTYSLLKRGIFDADDIDVFINKSEDFAFLSPQPKANYEEYKPRVTTLNLSDYKKTRKVVENRWRKIESYFPMTGSVLEIGAGDGAFLSHVHEVRDDLSLACLEPDQSTKLSRKKYLWLAEYESLNIVKNKGVRFDLICLFHVFEHLLDPSYFLGQCAQITDQILIEIPSLKDPLLALYGVEAYRNFYFQKQHPYIYSSDSICRVLRHHDWNIETIVSYQRYGLENHLTWLSKGSPGGNSMLRKLFLKADKSYIEELEESGYSDTVFVIASR